MTAQSTLRFLADMNLSPLTVEILCCHGHDVVRVNAHLACDTADSDVLAYAESSGLCLITQDLDFSALLAVNGYEKPSVVSLRLSSTDPQAVAERLLHVLPRCEDALQQGAVVSVEDDVFRIRRLPIG